VDVVCCHVTATKKRRRTYPSNANHVFELLMLNSQQAVSILPQRKALTILVTALSLFKAGFGVFHHISPCATSTSPSLSGRRNEPHIYAVTCACGQRAWICLDQVLVNASSLTRDSEEWESDVYSTYSWVVVTKLYSSCRALVYSNTSLYISSEAVAPVMISTSSPVMTACRVRLYRIWNLLIMSPAFLEAFCTE